MLWLHEALGKYCNVKFGLKIKFCMPGNNQQILRPKECLDVCWSKFIISWQCSSECINWECLSMNKGIHQLVHKCKVVSTKVASTYFCTNQARGLLWRRAWVAHWVGWSLANQTHPQTQLPVVLVWMLGRPPHCDPAGLRWKSAEEAEIVIRTEAMSSRKTI